MTIKENRLRAAIRAWPEYDAGLISFIEPGIGADTGLPDCLIQFGALFIPVELKRGHSVVKGLRPTQRLWHRTALHAGATTYGLSIAQDESVILVALGLRGGLAGDLCESELATFKLDEFGYAGVQKAALDHYHAQHDLFACLLRQDER